MTRYRLTEVYEVDADSEDGAWTALGWGIADKYDSECVIICPVCSSDSHEQHDDGPREHPRIRYYISPVQRVTRRAMEGGE